MVSRLLTLVGSNGDEIVFGEVGQDFAMGRAARGFGLAPRTLTELEGAQAGSVVRYSRTDGRTIHLPIHLFGANRGDVQIKMDRIAAALDWEPGRAQPKLQFRLHSGVVFEIGVQYVSGAETQFDTEASEDWATWLLTLRCPDPFWTAIEEMAFVFRSSGERRGILPRMVKMMLASSQVLGTQSVSNPGDVPSPIRWIITGPGDSITATSADGEEFVLEPAEPLDEGDVRVVDTDTGEVVDGTGEDRYEDLGTAPKLWELPAGTSVVSVEMINATSDSSVVGLWKPRRRLVH